ncbi:MAG: hypothetical protein ACK4HV_07350, partial [Parachlamydiaceae bacterium]
MQPVKAGENGVISPPIAHPKKKLIVTLVVLAGVTATVSVVALAVLIPPVGAIAGAALVAVAIKVSIGAGMGSILCGGAAYLIFKSNKPAKPEDPATILTGKRHIKAVDRSKANLTVQPNGNASSEEPAKLDEQKPHPELPVQPNGNASSEEPAKLDEQKPHPELPLQPNGNASSEEPAKLDEQEHKQKLA